MARFVLCISVALVTGAVGCASGPNVSRKGVNSPTPGAPSGEGAAPLSSEKDSPFGCRKSLPKEDGEYGCADPTACPNLADDVRERPGFRIVGRPAETRYGKWFLTLHVADTCQHYFCALDPKCVKAGGSDTDCMHPTGCLLVDKLEK